MLRYGMQCPANRADNMVWVTGTDAAQFVCATRVPHVALWHPASTAAALRPRHQHGTFAATMCSSRDFAAPRIVVSHLTGHPDSIIVHREPLGRRFHQRFPCTTGQVVADFRSFCRNQAVVSATPWCVCVIQCTWSTCDHLSGCDAVAWPLQHHERFNESFGDDLHLKRHP
jgi:hypothetical protein